MNLCCCWVTCCSLLRNSSDSLSLVQVMTSQKTCSLRNSVHVLNQMASFLGAPFLQHVVGYVVSAYTHFEMEESLVQTSRQYRSVKLWAEMVNVFWKCNVFLTSISVFLGDTMKKMGTFSFIISQLLTDLRLNHVFCLMFAVKAH